MIDMHFHLLPGIDDGPDSIEESVALARAAAAAGTRTIVATPHVNSRTRNESHVIARLVEQMNERLASEGIELNVQPGAEIAITSISELADGELDRLALGGGRWLLVEPPFTPVAPGIEAAIFELRREGHEVMLAHPERCPALQREPNMLGRLASAGVLMSLTAGSLVGRFGGEVRRFALQLASEGLMHNVASDAHDLQRRPPGMADELERAGLGALRGWLTEEVPAAMLAGAPIPVSPPLPPPPAPKGRLAAWRFRRAS
jgi:protein-tyrosine phosphatase